MDNYAEIIQMMADVFLRITRELQEKLARAHSEIELLRFELRELREQTDTYYCDPGEFRDAYWGTKEGKDV